MSDEKTDALTDMAYYHGARHAMAALAGGMSEAQLSREMEARFAPARKWLAENRNRLRDDAPHDPDKCLGGMSCPICNGQGPTPQKGLTTEDQLERALDARMVPQKGASVPQKGGEE